MNIDQRCKIELLGMITAIGFAHEKELNIQPKYRTGEWKPVEDHDCWRGFVYNKCGMSVNEKTNFCSRCGADMTGE